MTSTYHSTTDSNLDRGSGEVTKKVMIVFYIGGLTYLEIAALRLLSKDPSFPYSIVMLTTKLINGSSFLKSLENPPPVIST